MTIEMSTVWLENRVHIEVLATVMQLRVKKCLGNVSKRVNFN